MLEYALIVGAIGTGVGAAFAGLAQLRMAQAWKIWAGRCDPKNPNFRPPLITRRP